MLKKNKKFSSFPTPDLIPLLDVIFVILIFFLYSSLFLFPLGRLDFKLPSLKDKERKSKISEFKFKSIYIDKMGRYFYANKEYSLIGIDKFLKEEDRVIIYVDKKTEFEAVLKLFSLLKKKGIKKVSFSYQSKK